MNPLTHLKQTILPLLVGIGLACFGVLPQMQAVSPAPDGCYPNFTTAEGCDALSFLAGGAGNTGLGWRSLYLVGDASFNTGVGAGALVLNVADSNTAVGAAALLLNVGGHDNVAVGTDALVYNDFGSWNDAVGSFALFNNDDGNDNNAFGNSALFYNIHASDNTAIGDSALYNNDITGQGLANQNTAVGVQALFSNTDGFQNTAVGADALFNNTTGVNNTAIGVSALGQATGQGNIGIGAFGGNNITTGDFNIHIFSAGNSSDDRTIRIGDATQTAAYIGGISGAVVPAGVTVLVDASGHLGTVVSSQRFKDRIKPMDNASEAIFALKPVKFRYKKELDPHGIPQFGLVAEEVEKVNPDLVARDKEGKPYSVRYEQVNAMLLNEFLKEHQTVQEQGATIAELKREIVSLTTTVKEQAAQIERVSAQVEMSRTPVQVVVTNP